MEKVRQKIPRRPSHSPGNRDGDDCGLRPSSLRFHSDGEPVSPGAVGSVWLLPDAVMPGAPHLSNCPMPDRKRKRRRTRRGGRNAPPGLGVRGRSSPCPQAAMRSCGYVGLEGRRGIRRSPQGNVDDGPRSWSGDYKKHTVSFLELSVDYIWATPVSRLTTWGDVAY